MSILVENVLLSQAMPVAGFGGITLAGTLANSPGCPGNPFRVFGSYALVLLLEGQGGYGDANGFRRPVAAGDMLLLFPELGHRYGPRRGQTWSEIYLVFEGPFFDCQRQAGVLRTREPVWRLSNVVGAYTEFMEIVARSRTDQVDACLRLSRWLYGRMGAKPEAPHADAEMERVRTRLNFDLDRPMDGGFLSDVTGLSGETVRKRFHAAFGLSPSQYRFHRKIEAAKRLLLTTRLSNKEIAASLGFADEFHFSKRFKASAGMSPRAYRRQAVGE